MIYLRDEFRSPEDFPQYETSDSAGFDISASEYVKVPSHGRALVKTGLYIDLETTEESNEIESNTQHPVYKGRDYVWEIQIRPRSGLALKKGITVCNAPGTIDENYPGEICVILLNTSDADVEVFRGNRIAQGVMAKAYRVPNLKVKEVVREGGFGSTSV